MTPLLTVMLHTGRNPTVLLVDDEPGIVGTMAATLNRAGFEVLCAETPMAALATALYKETPIDLLVTDIAIHDMSGLKLAEDLARYHPETRILFVAARPDTDEAKRQVRGRGYPVLAKPFTSRVFLAAVNEVLGMKRDKAAGAAWSADLPAVLGSA